MLEARKVRGMYYNDKLNEKEMKEFAVRVQKDDIGASVSITDEERGIMLFVPLAPVLKMLRGAENE